MISHHDALIYTMVLVSAADNNMTDAELHSIGEAVLHLPIFRDFDRQQLPRISRDCAKLLQDGDGLDRIFKLIKAALPERLRETAYALSCDVAAADGNVTQEESRMLEMIRHRLQVGRLAAAAIERGARARHMHPEHRRGDRRSPAMPAGNADAMERGPHPKVRPKPIADSR